MTQYRRNLKVLKTANAASNIQLICQQNKKKYQVFEIKQASI
ncbi:hypothetical protein OIU79_024248 [Salix purpurea]|uniref:Uncharacterized protein n=1 Tax=Salix purpurea TaxID=77065 RepID=A0A9Q1AAA7_SALPP|nr:hypothetical protein OIU79_024248 [Salix purpurea]